MKRRTFLAAVATAACAFPLASVASPARTKIDVYKGPECDCCGDWMFYLRRNGFEVVAHEVGDMGSVRSRFGITPALASCHTGLVDGYAIEGHVPATDIRRLLAIRPSGALGLAVPGMKHGSPGMETPFVKPQAYSVLLINKDGSTRVWQSYPGG